MKPKVYLIGILCASTFLFSACQDKLEEPTDRSYETYNGEIQSLGGIRVNKTITHLFENEDGEILYAYSERYDLDDDKYNEMVEAYGAVLTYENLDKPVFEIRRLSVYEPDENEDEEVKTEEYKNEALGFSLNYQSNWDLEELSDSTKWTAPELSESTGTGDVSLEPDFVVVAKMPAALTKTSENTEEERATEIRDYVRIHYSNLLGVESELSALGPDQQFAVVYKPTTGGEHYFLPRDGDLYEFSYYEVEDKELESEQDFAEMLSSFRFIAIGEPTADEEEEDSNEEEDENDEADEDAEPIVVEGYREFESSPFHFKISYPDAWYYSGGSGGYDFAAEPLDDGVSPDIRLDLNSAETPGQSTSGGTFTVTVQVEDQFFTLSGVLSLKDVMLTMSDSITLTEPDSES